MIGIGIGLWGMQGGAIGLDAAISAPEGFDWAAPITVRGNGARFSTDYAAASFRPETTEEVWVSTAGNDTTGNGTQALPYKTIGKALSVAAASAATGIHIRISAGRYEFAGRWTGTAPDKNLVVTAEGGTVISSTHNNVTWALQASGAYRASRTSAHDAIDLTNLDARGNPVKMTKVVDESTCGITPNSFFTDGTYVFVNTFDGRAPDNATVKVMLAVTHATCTVDKSWYISGITFEGSNPFLAQVTVAHSSTLVLEGCEYRYANAASGTGANGFLAKGVATVINVGCKAYGNPADGFNYSAGTNGISPKMIEIGCLSYGNGDTSDSVNNDNGSTLHNDCRGIRVNGVYTQTVGPVVTDIDTCLSWNLGCAASESLSTEPVAASNTAFRTAGSAKMWLEGCNGSSYYAAYAGDTSQIRHKNTSLQGATSGDVANY